METHLNAISGQWTFYMFDNKKDCIYELLTFWCENLRPAAPLSATLSISSAVPYPKVRPSIDRD